MFLSNLHGDSPKRQSRCFLHQSFTYVLAGIRSAKKLFDDMLSHVAFAPVSFYDTTPIGRVTNRFSGDTDVYADACVWLADECELGVYFSR